MTTRAWGNEYRTTTVCIDTFNSGSICGRLYNPYLENGAPFQSLMEFLLQMEQALDGMDFPQSFTAARSFSPAPAHKTGPPGEVYRPGNMATFAVRILFRQNASWQGSIVWLDEDREQSFRSVLELILLMNNALTQTERAS